MSRLSLALCSLALAALSCTSALADPLTFSFDFSGANKISGSGSFTATADGTNEFLIDSITGTTDTGNGTNRSIDMLLAPGDFPSVGLGQGYPNDNLLFYSPTDDTYSFDANGVSYDLNNGANINLYQVGTHGGVFLQRVDGVLVTQNVKITITPETSPVPEPGTLGLLATGALGLAGVVRRRFAV